MNNKPFVVTYNSQNNLFKGRLVIEADTIVEAQNKFLDWLKRQPVYLHMWRLTFEFEQMDGCLE